MANSSPLTFKLQGLDEIRSVLKRLPQELQDKVLATAVRAAAKPIVARAKSLAPHRTGALRESITAVVRKGKRGGVYAVVGPARGYYKKGKKLGKNDGRGGADQPANYAHLVEFGHVSVKPVEGKTLRKKSAKAVGFVPAKPFMRPALAGAKSQVEAEMANGIRKGIAAQLKRLVKNPNAPR